MTTNQKPADRSNSERISESEAVSISGIPCEVEGRLISDGYKCADSDTKNPIIIGKDPKKFRSIYCPSCEVYHNYEKEALKE